LPPAALIALIDALRAPQSCGLLFIGPVFTQQENAFPFFSPPSDLTNLVICQDMLGTNMRGRENTLRHEDGQLWFVINPRGIEHELRVGSGETALPRRAGICKVCRKYSKTAAGEWMMIQMLGQ